MGVPARPGVRPDRGRVVRPLLTFRVHREHQPLAERLGRADALERHPSAGEEAPEGHPLEDDQRAEDPGKPGSPQCHYQDGRSPVRDADGVVLYRADPLVLRDIWERVQARLAANPVSAKVNSWPLTQIAFCAACEGPMYGSTANYGDKAYKYYACMQSMRRDGMCTARRVMADELEDALFSELLALVGDRELTESKLIPGRDYSEDIARVAEQIGHLFSEIQIEALSGQDVREKQATLARAQEELARLHALKPVKALVVPVATGQTFRQRWESLDATGRNEFLRSATIRAVVSRDEMPVIEHQEGPLTPLDIPRTAMIDRPKLQAVIYLRSLGDMLRRADSLAATVHVSGMEAR